MLLLHLVLVVHSQARKPEAVGEWGVPEDDVGEDVWAGSAFTSEAPSEGPNFSSGVETVTGEPPTEGPPSGESKTEGPPTEGPPTSGHHKLSKGAIAGIVIGSVVLLAIIIIVIVCIIRKRRDGEGFKQVTASENQV
jgi:hypothetical protein